MIFEKFANGTYELISMEPSSSYNIVSDKGAFAAGEAEVEVKPPSADFEESIPQFFQYSLGELKVVPTLNLLIC